MDPFALDPQDGSAVDPAAFVAAVLADPAKRAEVGADAALAPLFGLAGGGGSDAAPANASPPQLEALQAALREAVSAERARRARAAASFGERSPECQRAAAPVPRATAAVYAALRESGLEYGPAFRLLRNVHVPLPPPSAAAGGGGGSASVAPDQY